MIERAVDELAHSLGIDPAEVRLRNYVPRENFPFTNTGGLVYDTGDYSMNLKKALEISLYDRLRQEQKKARQEGRLLGVGLVSYVEICGFGPDFPETAAITVSETGSVTVISGTSPHGQGHETPFSQIVADELGINLDKVEVIYGDTLMLPWATFTAGSRSAALGGSAILMCAKKIRSKMAKIAAKALDVPEDELVFARNQIKLEKEDSDKRLSFEQVASYAYMPKILPSGMEPVLYAFSSFVPPTFLFPFGTHIALVEIDRETGKMKLLKYISVDDCGKVLNPMIVEGQIHGGVAQGLGQAMLEEIVYDQNGQLLTLSFLDYQIPMAEDIPEIQSYRTETPTLSNPLGLKGIGEAGTIAATPTLINAVRDAIAPLRARLDKMPVSMNYLKDLIETQAVDRM